MHAIVIIIFIRTGITTGSGGMRYTDTEYVKSYITSFSVVENKACITLTANKHIQIIIITSSLTIVFLLTKFVPL